MASFVQIKKSERFCPECQRGINIANEALNKEIFGKKKAKPKKKKKK